MTTESRQSAAQAEAHEMLVDLLVSYVDRAYVTAGQPGALTAIRDLFRRMDRAALTSLTHQLDLATEPPPDSETEGGR